ncbi:MAG: hypothetical protein ACOYIT_07965 [Christensenellales bacterium]|jgi:hypothetical protein
MKLIDFDKHFSDFWVEYFRSHRDEYDFVEEFEDDITEIYDIFLDTPAPWLDNKKPKEYFSGFFDPKELVDGISEYIAEDIPVPELLLTRIVELQKASESPLLSLLDETHSMHERMISVTLLREIGSEAPLKRYIGWIVKGEPRELVDNCLESLDLYAENLESDLLSALPLAGDEGKQVLLSLLSRFNFSDEVFSALMDLFERLPKCRAELSSYIGRMGNEKALPALKEAALDENTGYLDYIEIRNAIETLGGEAPKRTFDESDPAYEIFKDE